MKRVILLLFSALLAMPVAAPAAGTPDIPRLAGIVSLPGTKEAILEFPDTPCCGPRQVLLHEGDEFWRLKVLKILSDRRSVDLRVDGAAEELTLKLNGGSNALASVELDKARLLSILELYGQFSDRTLLYWPSLPATTVSLRADPHTPAELSQLLKDTLASNGIVAIRDAEKFEMMVPSDQVNAVRPHPARTQTAATEKSGRNKPDGGVIDSYGADLNQVFSIYASMIGGHFDRAAPTPTVVNPFIWLHSKPGFSEEDGLYALDTLLGWRGIRMVRGTNGLVQAVQEAPK